MPAAKALALVSHALLDLDAAKLEGCQVAMLRAVEPVDEGLVRLGAEQRIARSDWGEVPTTGGARPGFGEVPDGVAADAVEQVGAVL